MKQLIQKVWNNLKPEDRSAPEKQIMVVAEKDQYGIFETDGTKIILLKLPKEKSDKFIFITGRSNLKPMLRCALDYYKWDEDDPQLIEMQTLIDQEYSHG